MSSLPPTDFGEGASPFSAVARSVEAADGRPDDEPDPGSRPAEFDAAADLRKHVFQFLKVSGTSTSRADVEVIVRWLFDPTLSDLHDALLTALRMIRGRQQESAAQEPERLPVKRCLLRCEEFVCEFEHPARAMAHVAHWEREHGRAFVGTVTLLSDGSAP